MAINVLNVEWLNENSNRKYPFFDTATLLDDSTSIKIPNDFIVDFSFVAPAAVGIAYEKFFISAVTIFPTGITVELAHENDGPLTNVTLNTPIGSALPEYQAVSFLIDNEGSYKGCSGVITFGKVASIRQYAGYYIFSITATRILPTLIRPALQGVVGIRTLTASGDYGDVLQGVVTITAGQNISLQTSGVNNTITVSAETSADFTEACQCPDKTPTEPIQTINGFPPDENGNFNVLGNDCLQVETATATLTLTDTCAKPCCGCSELAVLRDELNRLGSQVATQAAFAQRAMANIEQLRSTILASKLGSVIPC